MKRSKFKTLYMVIVGTITCCILLSTSSHARSPKEGDTIKVHASYYGGHVFEGKTTANCTLFDADDKTAAHKTLPLGTEVILKNPKTGCSERVTITDRGPFVKGRDIDVAQKGVGEPLDVANNTKLEMRIVYIPKKPVMGDACTEQDKNS